MIGIELVIFVVVVIAVLLFMYIREKGKDSASDSSGVAVSAQEISPEEAIEVSNVASEVVAVKEPEASVIEDAVGESLPLSSIPEDSSLRRHFIQQLTAGIEATLPERPTDSTLARHYDTQLLSLVGSKLDSLK